MNKFIDTVNLLVKFRIYCDRNMNTLISFHKLQARKGSAGNIAIVVKSILSGDYSRPANKFPSHG